MTPTQEITGGLTKTIIAHAHMGAANRVAEELTMGDVAPARHEIEQRIAAVSPGRHRARTAYSKLHRGGYPLGSGGIESSNKLICHGRLKRSGFWWYEVNRNQMLALRCAKYNGTQDQVFV